MKTPRVVLPLLLAIVWAATASGAPTDSGLLLYGPEGNRLRRYDVDTLGGGPLVEDILIERASAAETGGAIPPGKFRDINGVVCPFPDGSGRFIAGEDTGQPNPTAGWGVFSAEGRQIGKLTATYNIPGAEPFGCAFAPDGSLFTTSVGSQDFTSPNGQLIQWFPPFDRFPGAPGDYPNTTDPSDHFCKIAVDLGTATSVAIDDAGRVYVAAASQLSVFRFSPPFPTGPDAAGGCGSVDAQGSPLATTVQRETFLAPSGLSTFSGLAFNESGNLFASEVFTGRIREFDTDGNLIRSIVAPPESVPPISTGNPQSLAVGPDGTLYYADLDLVGTLPNVGPGPDGKLRRVRFDEDGDPLPPEVLRDGLRFPDGVALVPGNLQTDEWRTYAGSNERTFWNARETQITKDNVAELTEKWLFPTDAIITASPSVARILLPGEGRTPVAFILSWDANVYAVRVRDGSEVWRFATEDRPGVSFPGTASVHVDRVDGADVVFIANGQTFYALDAVSGAELWRFDAGTGCVIPLACDFSAERNEIEASALLVDDKVVFGMDVNDVANGKGGFYALDARAGHLVWFFDLESGETCRPDPTDDIRRYDPYHSEAELGLPPGFFATREGCDHPRSRNGCGNVWSSPSYDQKRGFLYFSTSNCDTDENPNTGEPFPPMPPNEAALVTLDLDGRLVWRWRPREVDNDDLAFGAAPNLFTVEIAGAEREVVGLGNKDGTYYLLDRDGRNEVSGVTWDDPDPSTLPYWATKVVPGGPAGGIPVTATVDDATDRVYFGTAPGSFGSVLDPQRPTMHALDARTGAILWQNTAEVNADATFAPTTGIPGVVFTGTVVGGFLRGYDADDGTRIVAKPVGFALAAAPAFWQGTALVGGGIGTRTGNPADASEITSRMPHPLTALCVPGTQACAVDQPVSGHRLRVVDRRDNPERRRLRLTSRDEAILAPDAGSLGDPTLHGAHLRLVHPIRGEEDVQELPADGWTARPGPVFVYSDPRRAFGACARAELRDGKLDVRCRGDGLSFTLDEASQDELIAALEVGVETVLCMHFGGDVRTDASLDDRASGLFSARDAPAPAHCALP